MNFKGLIVILALIIGFSAQARDSYNEWENIDINLSDLNVNNLRFTNRASCALDSKNPTESAFLLVNNMDAARGIYRLAKATGNDAKELLSVGVKVYRYTVLQLLQMIHQKLVSGELPLLPADVSRRKGVPFRYKNISLGCRSDEYCTDMDLYIEQIWKAMNSKKEDVKYELSKVDSYDSQRNFILDNLYINKNKSKSFTCHYLKKFSPLQAHLYGSKPNGKVFDQMARVNMNRGEYLGDCFDFEDQDSLTMAFYQLEINSLKERKWNDSGFDYWNSLKLYFSWAWRNAPEFDEMAAPFAKVLRAVAIEESVMLTPNGCKSITKPACDGNYLALNAVREFAKGDYEKEALKTDVMDSLPEGPQADLLTNEFPNINTDILDLAEFKTSTEWLENFSDNLKKSREFIKRKLITSVNFLNIVTAKLEPSQIIEEVRKRFRAFGMSENGDIDTSHLDKETHKKMLDELYYLCGEYTQANHESLSFIKGDLEILRKTTLIDSIASQIQVEKTNKFFSYYEEVAKGISKSCDSLKQKEVWSGDYVLDKAGFSDWYIRKIYDGKVKSNSKEILSGLLGDSTPLLSYKGYQDDGKAFEDILCINGSHCARKTLESIVDLYAVAKYANTFWTMEQKVKSPAMFNPYAERTQCKVYDPWFKTKKLIFDLFTTAGQAAMSAFVPGAVFANMSLEPGRVVSFKELVKEGKIEYDIKRKRTHVQWGLIADFGQLLGVPCSVSISDKWESNPYTRYTFAGISVNACYNRTRSNLNVYSASDIADPENRSLNICAGCTLNFETVTNSLTAISSYAPYVGPAMYMFKGMVQIYKYSKDDIDVPKNWKANPNYVLDTYRRFGKIPKRCVRKLSRGKPCLKNHTEVKVNALVKRVLKTNIIGIRKKSPMGYKGSVKVHGCEEEIGYKLKLGLGRGDLTVPANCAHLVKGQEEEDRAHEYVSVLPSETEEMIEEEADKSFDLGAVRIPTNTMSEETLEEEVVVRIAEPAAREHHVTEAIEEERAENLSSKTNTIYMNDLDLNNCSIGKAREGGHFLYATEFVFEGINEVGSRNSNWYLNDYQGYLPLYKNSSEQKEIVLSNLYFYLEDTNYTFIPLYPTDPNGGPLRISIENCNGYQEYKRGY